ncbi:TetR family transcriptional regulator [Saccharothrix saharensis]|uniref:TetR family transcriptional regulator n=1 Tax=Saccharothrix saharensis TaxID=571190 RepID=A0A543JNT3_9PSEU|nr:TetR/AcrR family transcriptional regulator [Saccharothrix saharensis]TQM84448.1 TetR family transcriptional regulator [Saccharothrix saharensis]
MSRRRLHSEDAILDATRDLLVRGGPDAATTGAISALSGAPTGSIYHRYGSRTRLFAEVWLRTVIRFQTGLLAAATAATTGSGLERVLAAADWTVEFAVRHPDDARLLLQADRARLLTEADLPPATRQALTDLNVPVAELIRDLATGLFGTAEPRHAELVSIAVVDVPYAVVRRHLHRGTSPEPHRDLIAATVRALVESPAVRA